MRGGEESKHDHHLILETMAGNQFQTELATQQLTPLCFKALQPRQARLHPDPVVAELS